MDKGSIPLRAREKTLPGKRMDTGFLHFAKAKDTIFAREGILSVPSFTYPKGYVSLARKKKDTTTGEKWFAQYDTCTLFFFRTWYPFNYVVCFLLYLFFRKDTFTLGYHVFWGDTRRKIRTPVSLLLPGSVPSLARKGILPWIQEEIIKYKIFLPLGFFFINC